MTTPSTSASATSSSAATSSSHHAHTKQPGATAHSSGLPTVLTYSLDNKMVYVTPAEDYEQALDFAYSVYPEELKGVPRERVSFSINIFIHGEPCTSRIGPMAWKVVISTLKQYELIVVTVHTDDPPHYSSTATESHDNKLRPPHDLRRTPSPSPSKKGRALGWIEKLLE